MGMNTLKHIYTLLLSYVVEMKNEKIKWLMIISIPLIALIGGRLFYNPSLTNLNYKVNIKASDQVSPRYINEMKNYFSNKDKLSTSNDKSDVIINIGENPFKLDIISNSSNRIIPSLVKLDLFEFNDIYFNKITNIVIHRNIHKETNYIKEILMPGLFILILIQLLLFIIPEDIEKDKEKGTLELYMTTSINKISYIISNIIEYIVILLIIGLIYFILLAVLFKLSVSIGILTLLLVAIGTLVFALSSLGSYIGVIVPNKDTITMIVGPIFFIFMIGTPIFYNIQNVPNWIQSISKFLPTTVILQQIRTMLFGSLNFGSFLFSILYVFGIGFLFLILSIKTLKWYKI
jgi:ABC-2 type transport system permease protein